MDKDTVKKMEEVLKLQLHNAYIRGLAIGGKSFVGVIYDMLIDDKKHRVNPALTLAKIEQKCKHMLGVTDEYTKKILKQNIAEAVDRERIKYTDTEKVNEDD